MTQLLSLEAAGMIELFFCDECGFTLTPCVPYGWQPIGEQWGIRSSSDAVVNLFGMLSKKGKLITYATKQNINSDFIIECIDEIAERNEKPVVLVLDNAPWHKAQKVKQKQEEWSEKELFLFFLPVYSPHLNLIETLWRKMKYQWLKSQDYQSASILREAIFNIIKKYDQEFQIKFS